ncbi:PfkB family carbohydrate kinase [Nereida sp. MMG025]|uniref:PfkB family carbohydrate kinase n=1 Tax=Nereida sp. MMG025 TaxID=2909981 RepID=UPI001F3BFB60|nr:PfkB family carbohydrate kinase [Nereida sp. MMG025]MCF6443296.1 PfkB family carbohydrate kinase [Nereida sp. MMG025]
MTEVLCIGSVLWDIIGRHDRDMIAGNDRPGHITRLPGGVALNVAMTLRRFDLAPVLLSAVGTDPEGNELARACAVMGMDTQHLFRPDDLPTDRYMAIEGANGLIAAIADAHSLEAAGDAILAPLHDGRLGSAATPYTGTIVLDGNLTKTLLEQIADDPAFAAADLRLAPASPGKAGRLLPLLHHPKATIYVNLEEAGLLCNQTLPDAPSAAQTLRDKGATRVLVTNGAHAAAFATDNQILSALPPKVRQARVTGAGDTFMAAHIAAERAGAAPQTSLQDGLAAAAHYVSVL